ncbi:PREDICTED: uncharacterized protein LOC109161858 [Ipomoea nil]|uniref:uncharacterized protein LOC109161858 n=1 Tax=Ipomoea nil TaxID=35883 RepID=UPI00090140D8|nr:PREDICTED: uncharacterized protein LOC109161858 [Ipomoea nil]XP_019165943.1 PREDICTED: uncharacterized protein LOC109161858 [Ipomoea nil]XP_019165944.1 PREDICTED: uncharacterized protein LOC109161858 [Ipomoea nil]
MGNGSELQSSKPPRSSSLSGGSSSHDCSQLYPKATASSFSFYEAGNDSNDKNGKVLNASTSSAPTVSDGTGEYMVQNWSPTQSPPIQVMEKPGDFDFNGISSTSDLPTQQSFSFGTLSDNKDTNGTHSKMESFSSDASKTSEVTREPEVQNESPTHSPSIQVMEMPGDFETNENPSSISMSKSTAWSNTSNGSLFSIDIGPNSFSTDGNPTTDGDSYKSGELDTHGDLARYKQMPLGPEGAEYNKETPANRLGAGSTRIKNGANQHAVPLRAGENAPSHLVGTRTSNKPVDLQMTKKSEPTGRKCCCAGFTCDSCFCSSPSQCAWLSCRGCCCKWFSGLSFSCESLRCKGCCSRWPITCLCSYLKCPSWKSCHFPCSFCCTWNCCAKNSRSSIDNLAKDGGRITRVAA